MAQVRPQFRASFVDGSQFNKWGDLSFLRTYSYNKRVCEALPLEKNWGEEGVL